MRLLLLLLLVSCSSTSDLKRTALAMGEKNSLLYSNGSTHPYESLKKLSDKGYEVEYRVLIKNNSESNRMINLEKSSVVLNEQEISLPCKFNTTGKPVIELAAKDLAGIKCVFQVEANSSNQLQSKDTIAKIQIGLNSDQIDFEYHFRIEDFKNVQKSTINSDADRTRSM